MPGKYKSKYRWIAKEFSKIPGVKNIDLVEDTDHLSLLIHNNRKGKGFVAYTFWLKQGMYLQMSKGTEGDYYKYDICGPDIDSEQMVAIGVAKCERLFSMAKNN